ncbi:MAG: DUF1080 domain-containing protein, partial [Thermoguttaceae bacterium]
MSRPAAIVPLLLLVLALGAYARAQGPRREPPLNPIMGEFAGTFTPAGGQPVKAEAKVIADQKHMYRVVILYPAGDAKATRIELAGLGKNDEVAIQGREWSGKITKEAVRISSDKAGKAEMKRIERKSPTLCQKPPDGAVVLLPYEEGKPTNLSQWVANQWICQPDGTVSTVGADIATKKEFGSFKTHVEFCVPFMPAARGQERGNSGVFLHGRYEIQILDSFGLPVTAVDCAAIFGQRAPDADAALPPGQWQTYDIDFRAPEFNAAGKQTKGALITVVWNGVKVLDAVETKKVCGGNWGPPG